MLSESVSVCRRKVPEDIRWMTMAGRLLQPSQQFQEIRLFSRGRRQLGFQLRHLRLQALQPCTRAGQHHHLAIKLFPAHQVEFAEAALQQRLELAFDF